MQNAIQSEYWRKQQNTAYFAVVYFKEDRNVVYESYAIISKGLKHNTSAVHIFMERIIAELKEK